MKLKVKEFKEISEGRHTGKISRLEFRTEPYEYTDVYIELDNLEGVELKYGCPTNVSHTSKLGRLLALFVELNTGDEIDLEETLVGQTLSFMTINEVTDRGSFAGIVEGSVKRVEA